MQEWNESPLLCNLFKGHGLAARTVFRSAGCPVGSPEHLHAVIGSCLAEILFVPDVWHTDIFTNDLCIVKAVMLALRRETLPKMCLQKARKQLNINFKYLTSVQFDLYG